MSPREFEQIVARTLKRLPAKVKRYLDNVVVVTAEEPDHDLLLRAGFTEEEIADGETLLGLFDPLELPSPWGADSVDAGQMLRRVWLFRQPHLDAFPDPEQCRIEVRKTLIHELAHHFGLNDRDLEPFDATDNPFR